MIIGSFNLQIYIKYRLRANEYNNELYEIPTIPKNNLRSAEQASCSEMTQQILVGNAGMTCCLKPIVILNEIFLNFTWLVFVI